MGENLDVKYCIAARLIQNLSGAARRAALQLTDEELKAKPDDPAAGIKAVLEHLRKVFSPDPLLRKAQTLSEFFGSRRYYRRQGQRMTDYVTTFDEGVTFGMSPTSWLTTAKACLTSFQRSRSPKDAACGRRFEYWPPGISW